MSNDTDLRPALEEVIELGTAVVEVATLAATRRPASPAPAIAANRVAVQPYSHWIGLDAYSNISDDTDYAS